MASSPNIKFVAAFLLLLISLSCKAQDGAQPPAICQPEPVSRPAINPSSKFWRVHPNSEVRVDVRFRVAPDGSVVDVELLQGDYHVDYASETKKAVRKWVYRPFSCAPDGVWLRTYVLFIPPAGSV
jgi:hypothetical protein